MISPIKVDNFINIYNLSHFPQNTLYLFIYLLDLDEDNPISQLNHPSTLCY